VLKLKILHLECLPPDAGLTAHALSNITTAFELLVVNNKASYIDALTVFMPDVILADHYLSSFSADDAFQLLKQKDFKTPFIVVAAPFSEDFAISLMQQGAADYVLTDRLSRLPFAILNAVKRDNPKALNAGELQNGTTEIRSEDALKRSEANLSAIIENTSDLVLLPRQGSSFYYFQSNI
jgi:DNA-binding NtrC family response regulator